MPLVPALFALGLAVQARPAPAPPTAPPAVSTDRLTEAYFLFLQGRDLEDRNDIAGAVADFRRAAELCPSAADIQAELALALGRHGDSPKRSRRLTRRSPSIRTTAPRTACVAC